MREMVRQVVEGYPDLPDEAFVMARQENLETIHRHNVVAERYGTLGDLRAELDERRAPAPPPRRCASGWRLRRPSRLGLRRRLRPFLLAARSSRRRRPKK